MLSSVAGHFADALIAQKWTVLSVRRMMTCLGLVCPGIFLLFFSAVNNLALAVMFVYVVSPVQLFYANHYSLDARSRAVPACPFIAPY